MRLFPIVMVALTVGCGTNGSGQGGSPPSPSPESVAAKPAAEPVVVGPKEAEKAGVAEPKVAEGAPQARLLVPEKVGPMSHPEDALCVCVHPVPPPPDAFMDPLAIVVGPGLPLVSSREGLDRKKIGGVWFEAPLEGFKDNNAGMFSGMDAAMNPDSILTALQTIVYASKQGQLELLLANLAPLELELFDVAPVFGVEPYRTLKSDMDSKLRAQGLLLGAMFGEFKAMTLRQDRFFGEVRLSLASFAYTDKSGSPAQGCVAFVNVTGTWRIFDMTCTLPKGVPMPKSVPGASVLDLTGALEAATSPGTDAVAPAGAGAVPSAAPTAVPAPAPTPAAAPTKPVFVP